MRPREHSLDAAPVLAAMKPIAALALSAAPEDGTAATLVPFLSITRADRPTQLRRGVLTPSVCLVVQGRKRFLMGEEPLEYGVGSFLASMIDMPAAGHVIAASPTQPYLGVRLAVGADEVASVVLDAKIEPRESDGPAGALFVGSVDVALLGAIERLLELLRHPRDAAFLAPAIKREILYRLLTGPSGHLFQRNVMLDRRALGIAAAIEWLRDNFDRRVRIEEVAKASHMSVSSLQHKFKAVTSMGPLQYQKRLRLEEARRQLLRGGTDATTAAFAVGYESASQFSREYRRLFGLPPSTDARLRADGRATSDL